jgi:general L-amino acid transport system permease protein
MTKRLWKYAGGSQSLLLLAVLAAAWLLVFSAHQNLARHGVTFGFGFLGQRSGFNIPFHLISWNTSSDTNGRALLVSVLNTLLVSGMGIVTASLIGTLVGVMRLSANWLVRTIAVSFIEAIRNTPVLVQITFWYVAVLQALPSPRQSIHLPLAMLLNVRGLYIARPILTPYGSVLLAIAALLIIGTPFVWRLTIRDYRIGSKALLAPVIACGLAWLSVVHFDLPVLELFNVRGGIALPPELVALWAGLSIYSSAFIAEIVRSSIEAVPKGQYEAAQSIGLHGGQRLFLVTLPQAIRLMLPPLTSQYLNLIKNSSLGAAIAYPEVFEIFTGPVLSTSGHEIETMILLLAVFLLINLFVSTLMNWCNRRIAIVVR